MILGVVGHALLVKGFGRGEKWHFAGLRSAAMFANSRGFSDSEYISQTPERSGWPSAVCGVGALRFTCVAAWRGLSGAIGRSQPLRRRAERQQVTRVGTWGKVYIGREAPGNSDFWILNSPAICFGVAKLDMIG